jgi:heme A synthase
MTAVKLMYAGAALAAIGFLTSLLTQDSVREQALERAPDLTESELDAIVAFGLAFAVIAGLIGVLLWVWMAETNRRGKSWARIVATVLGALNVVLTLIGLLTGQFAGIVLVFNLVSAVLAAAILYLLYRPDSNAYYEAMSDIRR